MSSVYDVGDGIRLTANFTVNDVATNPSSVVLKVTDPSGNAGTSTPSNSGTGAYLKDIVVDEEGIWYPRWVGTGAVVAAAEGHLFVRRKITA